MKKIIRNNYVQTYTNLNIWRKSQQKGSTVISRQRSIFIRVYKLTFLIVGLPFARIINSLTCSTKHFWKCISRDYFKSKWDPLFVDVQNAWKIILYIDRLFSHLMRSCESFFLSGMDKLLVAKSSSIRYTN